MCLEESKQLHDTIEELSNHVFEEYRKHMDFEPVVAILVKNPLGEFSVQYMLIPSIYMMEGKKGERGIQKNEGCEGMGRSRGMG